MHLLDIIETPMKKPEQKTVANTTAPAPGAADQIASSSGPSSKTTAPIAAASAARLVMPSNTCAIKKT